MDRISLKVTGAQGQGVNSVGEICGKGLKRSGYCVFGYREYMSLIKGGHSSYQLDSSNTRVESSETRVDILVNFNHHGLEENYSDVKDGGIILHQTPMWQFPKEHQTWLDEHKIQVVYLPVEDILKQMKAPSILGNVLITSVVWTLLSQDIAVLKELVREQFGHKGEEVLKLNFQCIDEGVKYVTELEGLDPLQLPKPDAKWKDCMYLTGSEAQGLGVIHAGCRMYVGYPMTPSSPLLKYIADNQNETGMVIKQAEDEITACQMMSGAMHVGTRAMTATSGGGFDLMTETISLNAIIENPAVIGLAQRPGPATGLPTWTSQGDLLLAVGAAHGEFPRVVLSLSDSEDAFGLMGEAFNYAEEYQSPVIVLTDKHLAEGLYTQPAYNQKKVEIRRGQLVEKLEKLRQLKSSDRYDPTVKDGVSLRWLPGSNAATYCAQGDEHDATGAVDETAENAIQQMEKRMKKMEAIREVLPEPDHYRIDNEQLIIGNSAVDLLLIGWGSTKSVVLDVLKSEKIKENSVGYLHYQYLWPLKTETLEKLAKQAKKVVLVEQNFQGQLGMLIKQECGLEMDEKILKYDGRPFFYDELLARISHLLQWRRDLMRGMS